MMQASQKPNQESLSGLIERVTFFNEETGFVVLRVKARGRKGKDKAKRTFELNGQFSSKHLRIRQAALEKDK